MDPSLYGLPCVGYSNERLEFYLARDLYYLGHPGEDGEFLETIALPVDQALAMMESGEITEAKTIIGCSGSTAAAVGQ